MNLELFKVWPLYLIVTSTFAITGITNLISHSSIETQQNLAHIEPGLQLDAQLRLPFHGGPQNAIE